MKKIKKLGIFDSGLGGYTVYKDLKNHLPELSMTLYADQKNAPYGNYDDKTILKLAKNAMIWFKEQGITDVLLACNTVTSVALPTLQSYFDDMRIWGIVDLTVNQLNDDVKKVGVIATKATVNAHAYKNSFEKSYDGSIVEVGMKDLAKAIEALEPKEVIDAMLKPALSEMGDVDTIILGCTHYPLVLDHLKELSDASFVDSILPIRKFITENYEKTNGEKHIVTTNSKEALQNQIAALYKVEEEVESI